MNPVTVAALFEAQVARVGSNTAVVSNNVHMSYRDLYARVLSLARRLGEVPIRRDDVVAVVLERSSATLIGLLGIMKAGGVYVPIDPRLPEARIEYILKDARPSCVLTERSLYDRVSKHKIPTVIIDDERLPVLDNQRAIGKFETETPHAVRDAAYIMYTSGSTGTPKGVVVSHRALTTFIRSLRAVIPFTAGDRLLAVTRTTFDISLLELLLPIVEGGQAVIAAETEVSNGSAISGLIREQQITVMQGTPSYMSWLVEHDSQILRGLSLLVGGEPFSSDLAGKLLQSGATVWNLYGPTEATIWSSVYKVSKRDVKLGARRIISIGKPLPDYTMYVLDEKKRPCPVGTAGELYIGGPAVSNGYLGRPELTSKAFERDRSDERYDMYKTGDLVQLSDDGNIAFVGRIDRQVKIRGIRVELEEIEAQLRNIDDVIDAVVVYRTTSSGKPKLVAYLVVAEGTAPNSSKIREALRNALPEYMIPATIVRVTSFPLTSHGKLDRDALPDPDLTTEADRGSVEGTEQQDRLCRLFADALDLNEVRAADNFLEVGGHSLIAMRLVNRIKDEFGIELPLRIFFTSGSVKEIFDELMRLTRNGGPSARVLAAKYSSRLR